MATNALSLAGRVAVVTGAGRGIGEATASRFAEAGARVALLDTDGEGATRVREQIVAEGGTALAFQQDVTDAPGVRQVMDRVLSDWGRLDVLVNNAGIVRDARLESVGEDDWFATLDVNAHGAMLCAQAAVPHMLAARRGRILSASSVVARMGNFGQTAYAASKGAIVAMTRVWARELGPHGITANAVAAGFIETEMLRGVPPKGEDAGNRETRRRRLRRTPEAGFTPARALDDGGAAEDAGNRETRRRRLRRTPEAGFTPARALDDGDAAEDAGNRETRRRRLRRTPEAGFTPARALDDGGAAEDAGNIDQLVARTAAGRLGRPDEVANVYLFLASDLASFINGAVVGVDGGLLL